MKTLGNSLLPFSILTLCGLSLLIHGVWLRLGKSRGLYFATHLYANFVYAEIPSGITLILWAIATIPQLISIQPAILGISMGVFLLGLFFNLFPPAFLKPRWLKWIEREHGDMLHILVKEANYLGLVRWGKLVKTQADLEAWVREVRQKHGLG